MGGAQLRVDPVVKRVAPAAQESAKFSMPSADDMRAAALARVQQMKVQNAEAQAKAAAAAAAEAAAAKAEQPVSPEPAATVESGAAEKPEEAPSAPVEAPVSSSAQQEASAPDAAVPTESAAPAAAAEPQAPVVQRPAGKLRRADSISMELNQGEEFVPPAQNTNTNPPLTQEQLDVLWRETLNAMKEALPRLYEQLQDKEVMMVEEDKFVVAVTNSYTEQEIKTNIIRILTYMRRRSGRPMLNCRVDLKVVERDVRPYTARDKYDALLEANPTLEMMRVIFPEVEM